MLRTNSPSNIDACLARGSNMGRIAVTDGMSDVAVSMLKNAGHEVVLRHHEKGEYYRDLNHYSPIVQNQIIRNNNEYREEEETKYPTIIW